MPIDAIIFDFDGLILDTETPQFHAWREVFAEHGLQLEAQSWVDIIGRPPDSQNFYAMLEQRFGSPIDVAAIRDKRKPRLLAMIEAEPLRPGVSDWLAEAEKLGLRIGLCSSSSHEWVEGNLHRLGVHRYFHVITCNEDTTEHKPHPEPFRRTCRQLGVVPARTIALEDSPNGVTSAKTAGLHTIAVPNPLTALLNLDHADLLLESLGAMTLAQAMESLKADSTSS